MPVIFRAEGIEYRIWSHDHNPPHVHVRPSQKHPDWEMIVFLGAEAGDGLDDYGREFGETKMVSGKLKISTINALVQLLDEHREDAWAKWHAINA